MYTTGVPLSPEPDVRSQRDPIKSVSCLGVVPSEAMLPTKLSDVEAAQKEILTIARKLSDSGAIMLNRGGGGDFV